ncbi:hypothetical protein BG000_002798 [Podila horticola]|nr:hypothetical protein BG000_002798 [Podila horticola]
MPPFLILRLKRYYYSPHGQYLKLLNRVCAPEQLDLGRWKADDYVGSSHYRHYISIVRMHESEWWMFNDQSVTRTEIDPYLKSIGIKDATPYVYLYRRQD